MNRAILICCALLALAACSNTGPDNLYLSFVESGPDGDHPVRMLITERYLRIEDGDDQDGFILFDRANRTVYSVSHVARSTLVVQAQPVTLPAPAAFTHRRESGKDTPPAVDGKMVAHYRYFTNDKLCFEVYAVKDFLSGATRALREYQEVLAGEQGAMQARMPEGELQVCELADLVFHPGRNLEQGFPLRLVKAGGVTRQLVDFKTGVPLEPKLFELPPDYKTFSPAGLRGG
jgi:hypothetical protein